MQLVEWKELPMPIEFAFLDYLQTLRTPFLDQLMLFVTALAGKGELALGLGLVLLLFRRTRRAGLALLIALLIGYILGSVLLKPLAARVRPCNVNLAVDMLVARPHSFSFPSGHATQAFAVFMTLYFAQMKRLFSVSACLGLVICFSRMYLYVHFPTDILGGALVGTLGAYAAYKIVQRIYRK